MENKPEIIPLQSSDLSVLLGFIWSKKIESEDLKHQAYQYSYLSTAPNYPPVTSTEYDPIPNISLTPITETIDIERDSIKTKINKEFSEDLHRLHGISALKSSEKVLLNEIKIQFEKKLINKILEESENCYDFLINKNWFYRLIGYNPPIGLDVESIMDAILKISDKKIAENRTSSVNFIIVNPKVASILQDTKVYRYANTGEIKENPGICYLNGYLMENIVVVVNPYQDDKIILGCSSGIKGNPNGIAVIHSDLEKFEFDVVSANQLSPDRVINIILPNGVKTNGDFKKYFSYFEVREAGKYEIIKHVFSLLKNPLKSIFGAFFQ